MDKEFEITLRGMLAQDESRNISENIQWGFQRKFEKGDIFAQYKNFMGYTCVDGQGLLEKRTARLKPSGANTTVNIFWEICSCAVIVVRLTEEERRGARWYGDVRHGLKRGKRNVPTPLL